MPILRGAVSFSRFQVEYSKEPPKDVRRWLTQALRTRKFEPLDPKGDVDRAAGFVDLEMPERTEFAPGDLFQGERALFAYRVEQVRIPGAVLRNEMEKWGRAFADEKGRPPGRHEKAEQKEMLRKKLRSKTEPVAKVFDVSWNLESQQLQLWATSRKVIEEIQEKLEDSLGIRLVPRVPGNLAPAKSADSELSPTLELFGEAFEGAEVAHG